MQAQVAGEMIGIWDAWRAYEKHTGKPFRFYRACPLVGRGSVEHAPYMYEDCETIFNETRHISVLKRLKWWIDGILARHV